MNITVNFWAVLLAAVISMAVGFAWYGPLFGGYWKKLMGLTDESMKAMPLSASQATFGGFIAALITAYVLGHFAALIGVESLAEAWQLAFWVWLGFQATVSVGSFLWEGKSFRLFVLNAAEQLVATFLMALVFALI